MRTSSEADKYLFHSLRLTEEEAAGKTSYEQSRLLFDKYLAIIKPLGLELKTQCVRTWIYVRDIDSNYAGLVKARNDVFAEEGLSFDTHYIASTGIGGANECRSAVVAIDFLTQPGICEADKTYLKALSHLSPTHEYGVAFERGVQVKDHVYISGTASIDHRGHILHEGDVIAQTDRLLENIAALLMEAGQDGCEGVLRPGNARTGLPLRDIYRGPRKSADFWGWRTGPPCPPRMANRPVRSAVLGSVPAGHLRLREDRRLYAGPLPRHAANHPRSPRLPPRLAHRNGMRSLII